MQPQRSWPFIATPDHPFLSALWEVFAHGVLAAFVVGPLAWNSPQRWRLLGLAFVGGIVLDLDHAVAAKSLSPEAMESLSGRPATHSLVFATALALLGFTLTRRWVVAWGIFAILASHLLFDAAGDGVRWLFPLSRPDAIPWLACPAGIILLFAASLEVERRAAAPSGPPLPSPVDVNPVDEHPRGEPGRGVG
jgi:hypothetical protein